MNGTAFPPEDDALELEVEDDMNESSMEAEPLEPADPLEAISDDTLLQIMRSAYERSKTSRAVRKQLNKRNWDAFHGKFAFLTKKQAGQSAVVVPSLETSVEQVCAQLSQQLVGMAQWFSASYEGKDPPLPELSPSQAAKLLRQELDRLAVDGGSMSTTYGMTRLVYDAIKIGLIEAEVTAKVTVQPEEEPTYDLGMGGELRPGTRMATRLRVELVPFDDYFPDPDPVRHYDIHEVVVSIADLPELGFDDDEIEKIRLAAPGMEKQADRQKRDGIASGMPVLPHQVLLREYWGDLIDPTTGRMLAEECFFIAVADTYVIRRPVKISELLWHGKRPFVSVPLLPTPVAQQHHAFLDIAVPLVEVESELTNLVIDGGFNAALGAKVIHSYKLVDPTSVSKGITPGWTGEVAEGYDGDVIQKVDTGTLTQEMLTVLDRHARMRQEAFRINDLQLGRQAERKTSATEINEISESSSDLFSNIALRFEDTWIEPLLELCWLTMWQFADQPMVDRMAPVVGPDNAGTLGALTDVERFVAFASAATFKVQGYKYQLQAARNFQKLMMLQQYVAQNPAVQQLVATEISPMKQFKMALQALGIDPEELKPDPDEQPLDPMLLQGQAGNPQGANPAVNGGAAAMEEAAPPNMMGDRGIQSP
jgi:hypothetical protein